MPERYADLIRTRFAWAAWETLLEKNGYTIDRPYRSCHPDHPTIVYPIDYGYLNGTVSSDGHEVDVFVGTASNGLVGTLLTTDHRRGDREFKLLYHCRPEEVYLVNGFLNFDRTLMEALLVLRYPLHALWEGSSFE
jgi:inorganic pyrophosphatase